MHPPQNRTVETWALSLIQTTSLEEKLDPAPPPGHWEACPPVRRLSRPGRPPQLRVLDRARKAPRAAGLGTPRARASLFALLHHHEVQAAELFAWALLAFPSAPHPFRRGLVLLSMEELEHARMYREQVVRNGSELTDFAVRDWFWEHIPRCDSPTQFVSLMGLGFEAGNLEHADRYARGLEAAGDAVGAGVCRRVASDEEAHVRFAARWFRQLEGEFNFDAWMASLPGPLSPSVLRGARLARDARGRAGFDGDFLDRLEGSGCVRPGS